MHGLKAFVEDNVILYAKEKYIFKDLFFYLKGRRREKKSEISKNLLSVGFLPKCPR